jgi:uncharacterized protein YecE (DUF72 family)
VIEGYYLGCPGWAVKTWVGRLYPTATRATEFLERYARVFNTVEGNTTFYALPTVEVVARWNEQTPDSFRFCFKFPRIVSHDKQLIDAGRDVQVFLDRIAPLGDKLGTIFLQLAPNFSPAFISRLLTFLDALPAGYRYAVELRHEEFFRTEHHDVLDQLRGRGIDLVTMDARGLHRGHSLTIADVRARKPKLPVFVRTTGRRPLVRCVPHETFEECLDVVEPWASQIARWIGEGLEPYFFMHAPDDTFAAENAYAFHALVRKHREVGELPAWPGGERQLSLL